MAQGMILRKTVHSACPTKGSLMSEGIRGFLHLQIKKPNLYPELLHPVNGIVTSKNFQNSDLFVSKTILLTSPSVNLGLGLDDA